MSRVKDVRRKAIKVTLMDGVEREVKFTLNSLAEIEEKYGTVEAGFKQLEENKISAVRFILWAGLMECSPELTERQVGSLIDVQYMQELMETLGTALDADMPTDESTETPSVDTPDPNV